MKKHRMPVCLSNMLTVLCVLVMLLVGLVPAEQVDAYSVEVSYYIDGLDLDLGTVELDPTVVVILMGEHIERILEPSIEKLNDFQPSVDIGLSFHPEDETPLQLVLQNETQVALVDAGLNFDALNDDLLGGLEFKSGDVKLPVTFDTLLVLKTDEGEYYKLRFEELANFAVNIDYAELGKGNGNPGAVPEPSTFLLLGLGLLGVIHMMKRKKGVKSLLFLLLTGLMLGTPAAFAQEEVITITKAGSTGDGTIVFDDYRCEPGCTEFTIPYSENSGAVLKAIPDEDSRFTYWKTSDNHLLEGEWQVESGDTIVALFQDKRELFAEDLRFSEPPNLSDFAAPMNFVKFRRARYLKMYPEVLLKEDEIILNLFDDVSLLAKTYKLDEDDNSFHWIGDFLDEFGFASILWEKNSPGALGSVSADLTGYTIVSRDGAIVVLELDNSRQEDTSFLWPAIPQKDRVKTHIRTTERASGHVDGCPIKKLAGKVLETAFSLLTPETAYAQSSAPAIKVLVVYTQEAKEDVKKRKGKSMEKYIEKTIEDTNWIYAKSEIQQRLYLAGMLEIPTEEYKEKGCTKQGCEKSLRYDDGNWLRQQLAQDSKIRRLREECEADLVSFWVKWPEGVIGDDGRKYILKGIGGKMEEVDTSFADKALSVVVSYAANLPRYYVFAHETAHNMGANHEWGNSNSEKPYRYSHGYVDCKGGFSTMMGVGEGCLPEESRLPVFSNPDLHHKGWRLGVPETEDKPANNALTLNMTAATVAAFRPKPTPPTPKRVAFSALYESPGGYAQRTTKVLSTSDGGYLSAGGIRENDTYRLWLVKADALGRVSWSALYGEENGTYGILTDAQPVGAFQAERILAQLDADPELASIAEALRESPDVLSRAYVSEFRFRRDLRPFFSARPQALSRMVRQAFQLEGYLLLGTRGNPGFDTEDVRLLRLDAEGKPLWERIYGSPADDGPTALRPTADGHWLIGGSTEWRGWLMKVSDDGTLLWRVNNLSGNTPIVDLADMDDGSVVALGGSVIRNRPRYRSALWLGRFNQDGPLLTSQTFAKLGWDFGRGLARSDDDGYLVVGEIQSWSNLREQDVWVLKFDAADRLEWQSVHGRPDYDQVDSALQMPDGDFLVGGGLCVNRNYKDGCYASQSAWFLHMHADGTVVSQRAALDPETLWIESLVFADEGYAASTYTGADLLKLRAAEGSCAPSPACPALQDVVVSSSEPALMSATYASASFSDWLEMNLLSSSDEPAYELLERDAVPASISSCPAL